MKSPEAIPNAVAASPTPRRRPQGRTLLSQAVTRALERDRNLCLESPDRPDWTPALLGPIVADAERGGGQAVLVTASQAPRRRLLDELNKHPFDSWSFSVGVFRPVQDYLCLERLELLRGLAARLSAQPMEVEPEGDSPPGARRARRQASSSLARGLAEQPHLAFPTLGELEALAHAADEVGAATGLLETLPSSVSERVRGWGSVDDEECLKTACPFFDRCPAWRARRTALDSTLVITDYAGLGELGRGSDALWPNGLEHRVVVLLEAHAAVDEIRKALTWELALELLRPFQLLLTVCGAEAERRELWRAALEFFGRLTHYRDSERYEHRLQESHPVLADGFLRSLEAGSAALARATVPPELDARFRQASNLLLTYSERLEGARSLSWPNRVVWLDLDEAGRAVIVSEPRHVCLTTGWTAAPRSVIAHSELLSTRLGFAPLADALNEDPPTRPLMVPPPRSEVPKVLVVIPESTPDTAERTWPAAVASRFIEVLRLGDVPTIGCFSSSAVVAQLQETARRLMLRLPQPVRGTGEWVELCHEPGTLPRLEGLGSAGAPDAYRCVVVDRLPFITNSRAWLEAIKESEPDWFEREVLPRAVAGFRQAVAYALRSDAPRAVVVVFDRRLVTRSYGQAFLEGIPGVTLSRSLEDIGPYLRGKEARR